MTFFKRVNSMYLSNLKFRSLVPTAVLMAGLCGSAAAHAYKLKTPWRGDSLSTSSTYVALTGGHSNCTFGSQVCPYDIGVFRWDNTLDDWSLSAVEGQSTWLPSPKENDPMWGMPLYSPVDGEIIACWNGAADHNGTNCTGCSARGNHVVIRTADDRIVFMGHMRQGSIPSEINCPNNGLLQLGDSVTCSGTSGYDSLPTDGVLTTPIPVRQGQLVGQVGTSGATGGNPHLHLHVKPFRVDSANRLCVGPHEQIFFDEAFAQDQVAETLATDEDWAPLMGNFSPFDGTNFTFIWGEPSGIKVDELPVAVGEAPALALTRNSLGEDGGAVAYINSSDRLTVLGFGLESDGTIIDTAPEVEGVVKAVALARIDTISNHVITAVQNGADNLQIVPYFGDTDHQLTRSLSAPPVSSNTISLVKATRSPTHKGIVTAVKTGTGELKVENFGATVSATSLQVDARGSASTIDDVNNIDIATVVGGRTLAENSFIAPFKGVVTVEQRTNGSAWIRTWSINSTGQTVANSSTLQAKSVQGNANLIVSDVAVSVVGDAASREFAVVSLRRASDNHLFVQVYQIASTGALLRMSDWEAGSVTEISTTKAGTWDLLAGVRTSGELSLLSFSVRPDGSIGRTGTRDSSAISALAVDAIPAGDALVVATVDSTSDVALLSFRTNYSSAL